MSGIEQQACISGWGSATMVAPIWGYFDESGEHGKDGKLQRLTLGGFYAPWPELKRLCERWREALDAEGLASFHMTDIASDEYDYENWPSARQVRLNRFVDILCDHAISFGAFSYSTSGKRKVFADTYQHALGRVLIEAV
jgi:hypothetical protein